MEYINLTGSYNTDCYDRIYAKLSGQHHLNDNINKNIFYIPS